MATSGQINTNTLYDSFFWVYWHQESQDIATNKTTIYWSCGVTCGHKFYSNAIKMSAVTINGVQVYGGGTYSNFSKGEHRIANGYMDIYHKEDGSKSFNISPFTGWLYSSYNYSSNGGSYDLPDIPRKATLLSATDFTDLENPSVTYSNPAGGSASSLQVYIYDTDDTTILVDGQDLDKNGNSYTLSLQSWQIDRLRNATTGKDKKVWFYIRTIIGGVVYWSNKIERTFSVEESDATRPSVSITSELNNTYLPSAFAGMYIQGKSRANITVTADGKYSAGINSRYATVEGKTYDASSFTSDVIQSSGEVKITGYATDTRGFTGSAENTIQVISYAKPMVAPLASENAILCYRSDGNGNRVGNSTSVWIKARRVYYTVMSNGVQKNFCSLQWRRKKASEAWDDKSHTWNDLISRTETTTDSYSQLLPNTEFALSEAYTIQVRAEDDFGEYDIKTLEVPTRDVALHLGHGGKNVSIGSYCDYTEDYTFHSEWKAIFDKEVVIGGQQVVNHVVEECTDGIWRYRKWADGSAECRGLYKQANVAIETVWGNLYESAAYVVPLPSGLFVDTPQFSITLTGTGGALLETFSEGSATETPQMCAVRPYAQTLDKLNTSIVAHGRWK